MGNDAHRTDAYGSHERAVQLNANKILCRHHFSERGYTLLPVEPVTPEYPDYVAFPHKGEDAPALVWLKNPSDIAYALAMGEKFGARCLRFEWNSKERRGETVHLGYDSATA